MKYDTQKEHSIGGQPDDSLPLAHGRCCIIIFFHLSSSLHFKFPMNTRTSSHHELMFSKGLHVKNLALNLVLLGRE